MLEDSNARQVGGAMELVPSRFIKVENVDEHQIY